MNNQTAFETKSSTQDNIEGTAKKVIGKFKVSAAQAVGNPRLESEGRIEQVEGAAQKKIGEIKKVFGQ